MESLHAAHKITRLLLYLPMPKHSDDGNGQGKPSQEDETEVLLLKLEETMTEWRRLRSEEIVVLELAPATLLKTRRRSSKSD